MLVAQDEVGFPMILFAAGLSDDFDTAAARAGELGGVGVVVDFDFLNGGSADACFGGFDAVDNQGDTACCHRACVEEARKRGHVVLAQGGEVVEIGALDADGVEVLGGVCIDLAGLLLDIDLCAEIGEGKFERDREGAGFGGDAKRLEVFEVDANFVIVGGEAVEAEVAVGTGLGGAGIAALLEGDFGGGNGGVRWIEKGAGDGLGQSGSGKDNEGQQEMH